VGFFGSNGNPAIAPPAEQAGINGQDFMWLVIRLTAGYACHLVCGADQLIRGSLYKDFFYDDYGNYGGPFF